MRKIKHEKLTLEDYATLSRRYELVRLNRIFRGELPETITGLYDRYGDGNPLVDRLIMVADMEMSRTEWLRDRIEYCVEQINTVRNLLFDLYANTHIEEIREALDRFTHQREMVRRLLETGCPLSMADREYLLGLLKDPSFDSILRKTSERKSTPKQ